MFVDISRSSIVQIHILVTAHLLKFVNSSLQHFKKVFLEVNDEWPIMITFLSVYNSEYQLAKSEDNRYRKIASLSILSLGIFWIDNSEVSTIVHCSRNVNIGHAKVIIIEIYFSIWNTFFGWKLTRAFVN